jgi:hypothetical protein
VNSYLIAYKSGKSTEVEADVYQADGDDWIFLAHGHEVFRVKADDIYSITKAR